MEINKNKLVEDNYSWILEKARWFTKDKIESKELAHACIEKFLDGFTLFTYLEDDDINEKFKNYFYFILKYKYVQDLEKNRKIMVYDIEEAINILDESEGENLDEKMKNLKIYIKNLYLSRKDKDRINSIINGTFSERSLDELLTNIKSSSKYEVSWVNKKTNEIISSGSKKPKIYNKLEDIASKFNVDKGVIQRLYKSGAPYKCRYLKSSLYKLQGLQIKKIC